MPRQPTRPHRRPLLPPPSLAAAAGLLFASVALAQQPPQAPPPAASGAAPEAPPVVAPPAPPTAPPAVAPAAPPTAPAAPSAASPPAAAASGEPPAPAASAQAPSAASAAPAAPDAPPAAPEQTTAGGNDYPYIPVNAERRSGLVLGLVLAPVVSFASGSPAKLNKRDQTVSTGAAVGSGFTLFLGGAFTDWFSFHIGASSTSATKGNLQASGANVVFGIETWPLFWKGGIFRDLGLGLGFGTGSASVVDKNDKDHPLAEGGGFSMVRANLIWDVLPLWRINLGPLVGYEYRTNDTYSEKIIWVGLRTALYTGP